MIICDAFDGCEFRFDCQSHGICVYHEKMDQRAKAEAEAEEHERRAIALRRAEEARRG